jgi:signal transduction histidine kinase
MKAARIFQLTVLALVGVSVVQAGYWLIDLRHSATAQRAELQRLYGQQQAAADELMAARVAPARIHTLLPDLDTGAAGAVLSPRVAAALDEIQRRHTTQYLWEGGFFLLALGACIAVIWMALQAETRVLNEQEQFLALVAHQFKTPLASLQLSLETMRLRELTPEHARTLLDRMLSDLAHMEAMVTQILESARLSRGRVDLKGEPLPLAPTVARVLAQYQERAQGDRIGIETDIPADLVIFADPLAVDAVVRNVLENALAAVAPVGGGRILMSARRVGPEAELSVRDSGIGFRPADQPQLFHKFSRLNAGAGSSYYGTGLGLFIVKRLMQLSMGRVTARSEGLGRGAEFVLAWPLAAEHA